MAAGALELPSIKPGSSAKVPLPSASHRFQCEAGAEVYLSVFFTLKTETRWAGVGHEVAWFQHRLQAAKTPSPAKAPSAAARQLDLKTTPSTITVTGDSFSFTFDQALGHLTHWTANNTALLSPDPTTSAAITPSFWRPPTDNDMSASLPYWQRFGVDALTTQLRATTLTPPTPTNPSATITFTTLHTPPVLDWGILATTTYTIHPSPQTQPGGVLTIHVHLTPSGAHPPLHIPRAGLDLHLPPALAAARWAGLGPGESYPDKRGAQRMGVWGPAGVRELQGAEYEVPQEGGNRMGTRWVTVAGDGNGAGVRAVKEDGGVWKVGEGGGGEEEGDRGGFSFRVGRVADRVVQAAKHPCDLVEVEATLLRLDGRVAGVGTAACGPGVREDLLVPVEEMEFGFRLEAVGV